MTSPIPKEVAVAAAMKLPAETWKALFEPLLGDVPVEPDPEIDAAWLEEVERRMRHADESSWIPADVVFAKLRAAASQPRPVRPQVEIDGLLLAVSDVIEACWDLPVDDPPRARGAISGSGAAVGNGEVLQDVARGFRPLARRRRWLKGAGSRVIAGP